MNFSYWLSVGEWNGCSFVCLCVWVFYYTCIRWALPGFAGIAVYWFRSATCSLMYHWIVFLKDVKISTWSYTYTREMRWKSGCSLRVLINWHYSYSVLCYLLVMNYGCFERLSFLMLLNCLAAAEGSQLLSNHHTCNHTNSMGNFLGPSNKLASLHHLGIEFSPAQFSSWCCALFGLVD